MYLYGYWWHNAGGDLAMDCGSIPSRRAAIPLTSCFMLQKLEEALPFRHVPTMFVEYQGNALVLSTQGPHRQPTKFCLFR